MMKEVVAPLRHHVMKMAGFINVQIVIFPHNLKRLHVKR